MAEPRLGMNGTSIRQIFAGRCVKAIVLTRPIRRAIGTATRLGDGRQQPGPEEDRPRRGKRGAEPLEQPERKKRLHDKAAGERMRLNNAASVTTMRWDLRSGSATTARTRHHGGKAPVQQQGRQAEQRVEQEGSLQSGFEAEREKISH